MSDSDKSGSSRESSMQDKGSGGVRVEGSKRMQQLTITACGGRGHIGIGRGAGGGGEVGGRDATAEGEGEHDGIVVGGNDVEVSDDQAEGEADITVVDNSAGGDKGKRGAVVWMYFSKVKDVNGMTVAGKCLTPFCGIETPAKGGSTSNLRSHIRIKHPTLNIEMTKLEIAGNERVTASKIKAKIAMKSIGNYLRTTGATTGTKPWKRDDVRAMAGDEAVKFYMDFIKLRKYTPRSYFVSPCFLLGFGILSN